VSIEYAAIVVGTFLVAVLLAWGLRSIEIRLHAVEVGSEKMHGEIIDMQNLEWRLLLMALNAKRKEKSASEDELNGATAASRMPTHEEAMRLLSRIEADLGAK
jgi:hypothetical protein